jgi:hypothetical protein
MYPPRRPPALAPSPFAGPLHVPAVASNALSVTVQERYPIERCSTLEQ